MKKQNLHIMGLKKPQFKDVEDVKEGYWQRFIYPFEKTDIAHLLTIVS